MSLSVVDIIILIVIAIAAIIGLKNGFVKMLFGLIKKLGSLIITYFLLTPTRNYLTTTPVNDKIYNGVLNWANKKGGVFTEKVPEGGLTEALLKEVNLPNAVKDLLDKVVGDGSSATDMTLGEVLSQTLTYYALTVIAFIGLLIVFTIVVNILCKFFTKLFESSGLNGINRLLGLVLGVGIVVIVIWTVFIVIDLAKTWIGFLGDFVEKNINPSSTEPGVARWLYNNNILLKLIEKVLNVGDILNPASSTDPVVTECIINRLFIK